MAFSRACTHANDDLDTADLGPGGRYRDPADRYISARDILQHTARFAEEMVMVVNIGIEIRAARLDHDFTHQAGGRELMENVVDRREGYRD